MIRLLMHWINLLEDIAWSSWQRICGRPEISDETVREELFLLGLREMMNKEFGYAEWVCDAIAHRAHVSETPTRQSYQLVVNEARRLANIWPLLVAHGLEEDCSMRLRFSGMRM